MAKDGYGKIFDFLKLKRSECILFTLDELANNAGYKLDSLKVYWRNKLRDIIVIEEEPNKHRVLEEIDSYTKKEFIQYISQKKYIETKKDQSDYLRENSTQALLSAIEIHNKPNFNYRYQIVVILIINAWELLFKAYLTKYKPDIKIIQSDGTTKSFNKIMSSVINNLGKKYFHIKSNLEILYEYRCDFVHFYLEEIEPLLFGLIQKAIDNYCSFIREFFKYKIENLDDLYILPIGLKRPISPIDYITNKSSIDSASKELKGLLLNIIDQTKKLSNEGNQNTIIVPFSLEYKNKKRLKNFDIVAAISQEKDIKIQISENFKLTDDDSARKMKISEESVYNEIFTESYIDIVTFCKSHISNWKQNKNFYSKMKELKKSSKLHKLRLLDPSNECSAKKSFYSKEIYKTLSDIYSKL